jgi:hypothetical protein
MDVCLMERAYEDECFGGNVSLVATWFSAGYREPDNIL